MTKQILQSGLNQHLQDLQHLIPHEVVSSVLDTPNNPEFQQVIEHIKSDYFKKIILTMGQAPACIWFLNLLQAIGLNVYRLVNSIHDLMELAPLPVPPEHVITNISSKMVEFFTIVCHDRADYIIEELLEELPKLKPLYDHIRGQEFQSIVQPLTTVPEYQEIKHKLCDNFIDVEKIACFIKALNGWNDGKAMPKQILPSGLHEDLGDLMSNIPPKNEVACIILDHMANVPVFQKFIKYVKSDDFMKIIQTIELIPAYIEFLNYLQISGLEVYELVNTIHVILELGPLPVPLTHGSNSLSSTVDEFIATIPHEKHKALFEEILKCNPELNALNDYICGQELQNILQSLGNIPEYLQMKESLWDKGIEVDKIVYIIMTLFGLINDKPMPQEILPTGEDDGLLHYLYLNLPQDEVIRLDPDNAKNIEFAQVIDNVKPDDFKEIILTLNKVPAYIEILNYVQAFGLDVYMLVNAINELLGIDPLPVPPKCGYNSLNSSVDKITINMPCEQFKAYFEEKLMMIPEIKALYDHICGQKFQSIVQSLAAADIDFADKIKDVIQKVLDIEIDVANIVNIIKAFFGFNTD